MYITTVKLQPYLIFFFFSRFLFYFNYSCSPTGKHLIWFRLNLSDSDATGNTINQLINQDFLTLKRQIDNQPLTSALKSPKKSGKDTTGVSSAKNNLYATRQLWSGWSSWVTCKHTHTHTLTRTSHRLNRFLYRDDICWSQTQTNHLS